MLNSPFLSLRNALVRMRVSLAIVFMAPTIARTGNGTMPQFAHFQSAIGLPAGTLLVGVVLLHAWQGWFVSEYGTGGIEYSVVLVMALLVVAAVDKLT